MTNPTMRKDTAAFHVFPIATGVGIGLLVGTIVYGRPVTGFVVGFLLGCGVVLVSEHLRSHYDSIVPGEYGSDKVDSWIKVPYYLLYNWARSLQELATCLGACLLVIGIGVLVLGIIALVTYLIGKGF